MDMVGPGACSDTFAPAMGKAGEAQTQAQLALQANSSRLPSATVAATEPLQGWCKQHRDLEATNLKDAFY